MSESRVVLHDGGQFDAREWLRRELLWGSVVAPYGLQFEGWRQNTESAYHLSSLSRRDLYAHEGHASGAFFQHGKYIASTLSSAALFRTCLRREPLRHEADVTEKMLHCQARSVDIAVGRLALGYIEARSTDEDVFKRVTGIVRQFAKPPDHTLSPNYLLHAAKLMSGVARRQAADWLEAAQQNEQANLPALVIHNGGYPRSGGDRVERLQQVFHQLVVSDAYVALSDLQI